jgi:hypothetical protein
MHACVRLHWRRVLKRCERGAEGECKNVAWQVGEEAFSFEEWTVHVGNGGFVGS